jgi:hypothetical protein
MDFTKILAELRQEREQLQEAILVIERLATGTGKRRGRPPAWMSTAQHGPASQVGPRKKRILTPEARARMAAAQKRRWAAYRKAQ